MSVSEVLMRGERLGSQQVLLWVLLTQSVLSSSPSFVLHYYSDTCLPKISRYINYLHGLVHCVYCD